jgi:type IV pilus assembly protein PilM
VTGAALRSIAIDAASGAPVAAFETTPSASLADSLRDVLGGLRVRPATVTTAFGLDRATVRRMTLPQTSSQNVDRMVRFEAERYIPLPLDAVELDYQVRPDRGADRLDVVLAAVRKDDARQLAHALSEATGARTILDTAGTGLLAAWSRPVGARGEVGEAVLLVDLSGDHASMVVCESGNLVLARSVPAGVDALRAALADDLKISAAEAEAVRRSDGVKGLEAGPSDLGAATEPPDREAATAWLTRLAQDVRRTLESFRSQRGGTQRCSVALTGEGAETPGLTQALEWATGQPIDIFDPLAGSALDLPAPGCHFTLAYGLALRSAGQSPVAIDLSPRAERADRRRRREQSAWVAALLVLVVAIGAAYAYADHHLRQIEAEAQRVRQDLRQAQSTVGDVDTALAEASAVQDVSQVISDLDSSEARPLDVLRDLSDSFPGGLWLKDFVYDRERGVTLQGNALDSVAVTDAVRALSRKPYLDQVKLTSINIVAIGDRQVYEFQISAEFPQPETGESEAKGTGASRRRTP